MKSCAHNSSDAIGNNVGRVLSSSWYWALVISPTNLIEIRLYVSTEDYHFIDIFIDTGVNVTGN